MIDIDSFINSSLASPLETERPLIPIGEYQAFAERVALKTGQKNDEIWARLDVTWRIDDPVVCAAVNRPKGVSITQGVMLDTDEHGDFDHSRNNALGRLYKALDMNIKGAKPSDIVGRFAMLRIERREYDGKLYEDVKSVTKK